MKTNFKTAVLALALVASVTGVFANNISNAINGEKTAAYLWDTFDRSGTQTGTNIPGDENSFNECPTIETDNLCAHGKLASNPSVVIDRYYQ